MSPRSGWLLVNEIVPRLRSAVPQVAHCVGSEDAQELVQDTTAMAAKILHNAERRGIKITPGNAAYYAIQHCKSGRRSTGSSCVDVMASGTQINGKSRLDSLEQVVASNEENGGEIFELHDVLSSDAEDPGTKAARPFPTSAFPISASRYGPPAFSHSASRDEEDPATKALRKIDWQTFMAGLSARDKAIIQFMVEGKPLASLARRRHMNNSTLLYHKRRLADAIANFMGSDILIQIRRKPNWKDSLDASRERLACMEERRH